MPYCLSCGKLRETEGGFCWQCRIDTAMRKSTDAKCERIRILKEVNRNKAERLSNSTAEE